jgi:hypothetical protein
MHWSWVEHAIRLLVGDGLDVNAANNKIKHGFAVRVRRGLRVEFSREGPSEDGAMPMSALVGALPIIDSLSVEFINRASGQHKGSWESTFLNLRPAPLLAESLLLLVVWGSVFCSAAARHFADRPQAVLPQHPGLLLGPAPERVDPGVWGVRVPLTHPANGGEPRGTLIESSTTIVTMDAIGPRISAVITDDRAPDVNDQ